MKVRCTLIVGRQSNYSDFDEARAEREHKARPSAKHEEVLTFWRKDIIIVIIIAQNTQRIHCLPVVVLGCTIDVDEQSTKTLAEEVRKVRLQLARAQKDLRELWLERDELDALAKRATQVGGPMRPLILNTHI